MSLIRLIQTQGHDVFRRLCSALSPVDIWNLSNTCHSLDWMKHTCWNINAHLSRFVQDPIRFRSLMAKHDAIVSGSNALQFFSLEYWPEADLDIYLPSENNHSTSAGDIAAVVDFINLLADLEGYELNLYEWQKNIKKVLLEDQMGQPLDIKEFVRREMHIWLGEEEFEEWPEGVSKEKAQEIYNTKTIKTVFSFENKRTGKKIQVIPTKCKYAVMSLIKDYYSTLVLNFYTWNKAYCLFPYLSIRHRTSVLLKPMNMKLRGAVAKYARRGYQYTTTLDPEMESASYINGLKAKVGSHRRFGDAYSWSICLDTMGIDCTNLNPIPDYLLDYATFSIAYVEAFGGFYNDILEHEKTWTINCETFRHPILEYEFIYDCDSRYISPRGHRWSEEMGRRTDKYGKLACWLFDDEGILTYVMERYLPYTATFPDPKPEGFRYRDDEVPKWYHLWEQQKGMVHTQQ